MYRQAILILILINVQYLQKVAFSFKKGSNGKNHFPSGPYHPIQNIHPKNFQSPSPLMLFLKTLFQVYLIKKNHSLFLGLICVNESLYGYSSVVWKVQNHSQDLFLTTKSPEILAAHLIGLWRKKDWHRFSVTIWLLTWDIWFGKAVP